jgi:hypothetical protein
MRLYLSAIFHERHYIRGEWRHGWVTTHLLDPRLVDRMLAGGGQLAAVSATTAFFASTEFENIKY